MRIFLTWAQGFFCCPFVFSKSDMLRFVKEVLWDKISLISFVYTHTNHSSDDTTKLRSESF